MIHIAKNNANKYERSVSLLSPIAKSIFTLSSHFSILSVKKKAKLSNLNKITKRKEKTIKLN